MYIPNINCAAAEILAPVYRTPDGCEHTLDHLTGGLYGDDRNSVSYVVTAHSDSRYTVRRRWVNKSTEPITLQTTFRVRACFDVKKYLIPCVSVNGNEFGAGGEPKGLTRDGKKWIFGYDREPVPSWTLTECADMSLSLFVSSCDKRALESSCSIYKDENGWYQEVHHPVIEAPLTYAYRDRYEDGYEEWLTLGAGEEFVCDFEIITSKPRWENFGVCDTLDAALELFGGNSSLGLPDLNKIWDNSITFANSLIDDYDGLRGFIIGFLPDGNGGFAYRTDRHFEIAWCGQNILFCRMFVEDYIRNGRKESLDTALEILDNFAHKCVAPNGLLARELKFHANLEVSSVDTCNAGYGAYEFIRVWKRLKEIGIDKPEYLQAAKGCCDFFVTNWSDEYGFGKQWKLDGTCLDKGGSIGAFVICAMAKLAEVTGERKYLETAEKAMRFYCGRDLDKFCCTAGALDTCCVDKETSTPFLISAILLYEQTGNAEWLEYAKKAAYYFVSWMFHYQPYYSPDSEIAKYNVTVTGLTSVSAQHHHLDMYGGIVVPYLWKLAELTGDNNWKIRGDMMWRAVLQYIGDGELVIHDVLRPRGSQNEALFHCRWCFNGGKRGALNDWLVAWPCAFRMSVLAELLK
nr:hypothetical protein [Clostridia bacterium]